MRATDRYTTPGSLAGLCGLTVPVRTASAPQAVLLTGAAFKEAELLALARSLEAEDDRVGVCDWASRVE